MSSMQIERANFIDARAVNPYGEGSIDIVNNYETLSTIETHQTDIQYKGLQKAEASYFLAGARLDNSDTIKQFNTLAKQNGYNKVNLLHRQDVNYSL